MFTLQELADLVGGAVVGDPRTPVSGVSEIQNGEPGTITFLANPKYRRYLTATKAAAVVVAPDVNIPGLPVIQVANPQAAFARILQQFAPARHREAGIHPTAIIHETARLGRNVAIGPHVVIEAHVRIGDDCTIGANTFLGASATLGTRTELYPNVTIYTRCHLGEDCIIHSGTVIGTDGYGFVEEDGRHLKIPQNGGVRVGNQVEMGGNCTIDRGTIGETTIGDGTKLDNQVHIAHNVSLGKGCLITGQVGIAGSVTIGNFCILAGHVGVAPHVTIGDRAIFAAKSGVTKSLPGGKVYAGMPAREIREQNRRDAVFSQVERLKKRLEKIEAHLNLTV